MFVRLFFVLISSCVSSELITAQEWPHWRGSKNGVSEAHRTPQHWSDTEGIAWRAEIPGHGISSPVVAGDTVYVTTAVDSRIRSFGRIASDFAMAGLAILSVPLLLRNWRTSRLVSPLSPVARYTLAVDRVLLLLVAFPIVVFGILMAAGPEIVNFGLIALRDLIVPIIRAAGRPQTNLWFLAWDETSRHTIWIVSTAVALYAFGLVPFLFFLSVRTRLLGAAALVIGVVAAKTFVPWPSPYGERYPIGPLIVWYLPVVALALWHVIIALIARRSAGLNQLRPVAPDRSPLAWLVPTLLASGVVLSANVLGEGQPVVSRFVVALNAADGRTRWQTKVLVTPPESIASMNSRATPTPAVTGDTVVVAFGSGTAAVSRSTGRLLWARTTGDWIVGSIYGAASSPVASGDAVYVSSDRQYEAARDSDLTAYSLRTGNELWQRRPDFAVDGFASPVIYHDGGRELLLTLTTKTLAAYDTVTGELVWVLRVPISTPIPTPVVAGDRLYLTGGAHADGYTGAYRLRRGAPPIELWASNQSAADVSSPVFYRGRLFTMSSTGVLVCYDADSGKIIWRKRVGSGPGVFYASLVAADGKIYATKSDGTTYVIAADDEFRLLATPGLDEETFASPAFGAGCLFMRTVAALYCIRTSD
jgi:outer membrane protein assembly factor BamB